jgi:hypothetical protein
LGVLLGLSTIHIKSREEITNLKSNINLLEYEKDSLLVVTEIQAYEISVLENKLGKCRKEINQYQRTISFLNFLVDTLSAHIAFVNTKLNEMSENIETNNKDVETWRFAYYAVYKRYDDFLYAPRQVIFNQEGLYLRGIMFLKPEPILVLDSLKFPVELEAIAWFRENDSVLEIKNIPPYMDLKVRYKYGLILPKHNFYFGGGLVFTDLVYPTIFIGVTYKNFLFNCNLAPGMVIGNVSYNFYSK